MGVDEEKEDGFPVLVVMGLDDRVSSPKVAKSRADIFSRFNSKKVQVETISDAGHCPHDEIPEKVADAILNWFATSMIGASSTASSPNIGTAKNLC